VASAVDRPLTRRELAARALELARNHRSVDRSRVEMMRRYAEMTDCRRRFLLRYFGEPVSEMCGACGNCDAGRSRPVVQAGLFSPGERVIHHQWGPAWCSTPKPTGSPSCSTTTATASWLPKSSGRHLLAPA
jgi:hypothetical protein